MNLLGQGCEIWIGFHLNVEVDGNYVFKYESENVVKYESENVVPTDGAKLMKRKFVSQRWQMEPIFSLGDSVLKVVTGVVPATKSPMPKSISRSY